jgi:hypothetical protein
MLAGELVFDGGDGCDRLVGFALRVVAARLWLNADVDVGCWMLDVGCWMLVDCFDGLF